MMGIGRAEFLLACVARTPDVDRRRSERRALRGPGHGADGDGIVRDCIPAVRAFSTRCVLFEPSLHVHEEFSFFFFSPLSSEHLWALAHVTSHGSESGTALRTSLSCVERNHSASILPAVKVTCGKKLNDGLLLSRQAIGPADKTLVDTKVTATVASAGSPFLKKTKNKYVFVSTVARAIWG